ncbi:PstS family phosphate ABC transporter substrate-binding protein [Chloroflexota bacterium]
MKKNKLNFLYMVTLILLFSACGPFSTPSDAESLRAAIARNYPAVDGSTSTHPLQRTLACNLLDVPCAWSAMSSENVQRTIIPDPERDISKKSGQAILEIIHNGTHGSYMNLIEEAADVILVARAPSEDELQAAAEKGVSLEVKVVALDAFVFLVNVENPVDDLAQDTLRDIYSGNISSWTELGITIDSNSTAEEPINAYQRNRNSGSQELMEGLVMRGTRMTDAPELITTSMLGPLNAIGGNPWSGDGDALGIGYSVYYYANFMFPHQHVKLIGIDGVQPTAENIASRAYPLTTEVYVAVREDMPQDSSAVIFRDWLLTEDGQAVIEKSGYVPMPIEQ